MRKDKAPYPIPVSLCLDCPCQQDPLQGRRRVSGCGVASAEVSAPGVFVGLTFSFCEMGTNLPLWQAAVRELTQT